MDDSEAFWILRDSPLTDGELRRLLASPPESEPAMRGTRPEGTAGRSAEMEPDRWNGPAHSEQILDALSSDGLHLTQAGALARDLQNSIESVVGGWVQKAD